MPLMLMDETMEDARKRLLSDFEDFAGMQVLGNRVLAITYRRPNRTKSGIELAEDTTKEDQFMGKAHLIVAMGQQAFVDDDKVQFPVKCQVGDWILLKPVNGVPVTVDHRKGHCRIVRDDEIEGVLTRPDAVW
jgi:co-chaperonin GroES (HSP10)